MPPRIHTVDPRYVSTITMLPILNRRAIVDPRSISILAGRGNTIFTPDNEMAPERSNTRIRSCNDYRWPYPEKREKN